MVDRLGRYPLSVILSYLAEADGTSFLLTRKRYAYQLLPVFRLPITNDGDDDEELWEGLVVVNDLGERVRPVAPVQRRKRRRRHKFVVVPVDDPTVLLARLNTRRLFRRHEPVHPRGKSTAELAQLEWNEQEASKSPSACFRPCHLQLLRFLDRTASLSSSTSSASRIRSKGLTLLVSYPRSGNSLARSLLERCTGIVTGSDTRPDFDLSKELSTTHDMVGEGVTSQQSVFVVKSHWPERPGTVPLPNCRRAIVLTRNPYDAIDSYWNMGATKSHTQTVTNDVYDRFRDRYRQLVQNEINIWLRFHHYWFVTAASQVPVMLVRYEDLVQQPDVELRRMIEFVLEVDQLDAYWESRVSHVVAATPSRSARRPPLSHPPTTEPSPALTPSSVERLGSYRPRAGNGLNPVRFGKALRHEPRHMTDDLVQHIHDASVTFERNYLKVLGYDALKDGFPDRLPRPRVEFESVPRPRSSYDDDGADADHQRRVHRPAAELPVRARGESVAAVGHQHGPGPAAHGEFHKEITVATKPSRAYNSQNQSEYFVSVIP